MLLALDTSYLYFRAFYGVPDSVRAPDGTPVNAVRGLLDTVARLVTLHRPDRLVAAWDAFGAADHRLRAEVEAINERRALEKLAEIEKSEGKKTRYYVEALMVHAKRVLRAQQTEKPDLAARTQAVNVYEETVKSAEQASSAGAGPKLGSFFLSNAKSYLVTAKQLMRRIRDHVPYSTGDRMMLGNAMSGWMVEGSPPRLLRDYNQLVESYNRGPGI